MTSRDSPAHTNLRNKTLYHLRTVKPTILRIDRVFVRRDLTDDELDLEKTNRKRCHQMNMNAGQIQFGMRDTEIIRYSKPRPFAKLPPKP